MCSTPKCSQGRVTADAHRLEYVGRPALRAHKANKETKRMEALGVMVHDAFRPEFEVEMVGCYGRLTAEAFLYMALVRLAVRQRPHVSTVRQPFRTAPPRLPASAG